MDVRITCLALVAALQLPAAATATDLTGSDRLALLYTPQLQFATSGDPMIKIGIIEGQSAVEFTPSHDAQVLPLGDGGPEFVLRAGQPIRVALDSGVAGQYRYWAVVGEFRPSLRERLAELQAVWEALGHTTRTFQLGSFFAVSGHTFDNRVTVLGVGGLTSRDEARALADELEQRYGVPAELHVELVAYPSGRLTLTSADGEVHLSHSDVLWITATDGTVFEVDGDAFSTNPEPGDGSSRRYVGSLIFTLDRDGRLAVVNELPAERLLEGILPVEIYATAPIEALKAQAVAARGELLADLGVRYLADPYMTCADQRCQVYRGIGTEHAQTSQAVHETRGTVILDGQHIAHAVYSASCGGSSGDYATTWGGDPVAYLTAHLDHPEPPVEFLGGVDGSNIEHFLTSRPETYDNIDRYSGQRLFRWEVVKTAAEVTESVNQRYSVGPVQDLEVVERDRSGRVIRLRIAGTEGEVVVERELPIRRTLGGLRSALFVMDETAGADGHLSSVTIRGGGFGHGVGLCQIGSIGAADRGLDYVQILSHYYRGTSLEQLWE